MKRQGLFLICAMLSVPSYGLDICAHTGTLVRTYKTNINGTSVTADNTNKTWRVIFDVSQTLMGISSCNDISGTVNTAITNLVTDNTVDVGENCWCKMEPVPAYGAYTGLASYWVLYRVYADATACAATCTTDCATAFSNNTGGFRTAIFNSIW